MDGRSLVCPSARPEMPGSVVLGVFREIGGEEVLHHLAEPVAATAGVLALARGAPLADVFRFAAPCAGDQCAHFDAGLCRLAGKIVEAVPAAARALPPCRIRAECRWYVQEGKAACLRCPLIHSETANPSPGLHWAADPAT